MNFTFIQNLFKKTLKNFQATKKGLSPASKLNISAGIVLLGFIAGVAFNFYYQGEILKHKYPFNTFLFRSEVRFGDFDQIIGKVFTEAIPRAFPFIMSLGDIFALIPLNISFLFFILIFIFYTLIYTHSNLKSIKSYSIVHFFTLSLLTYPFLFTIDRGNFETFVFIFLSLFVYFYSKNKIMFAILFLSLTIAMKGYTAIFLILFISDKRYKEVLLTILTTIIISLLSPSLYMDGNPITYIYKMFWGVGNYTKSNIIGDNGLPFCTSLLCGIKTIIYNFYPNLFNGPHEVRLLLFKVIMVYNFFALISLSFVSLYVIKTEKIFWRKIAILVIASIFLVQVSSEYRLIHLLIPIFLFIKFKQKTAYDLFYIILFSLLLIPKNYYSAMFLVPDLHREINLNVIINPVIMLIISIMIFKEGFKKRKIAFSKKS